MELKIRTHEEKDEESIWKIDLGSNSDVLKCYAKFGGLCIL